MAAVGLIAYLGGVKLLMHSDFTLDANRAAALVNLALAGGLLLILADARRQPHAPRELRRHAP